MQQTSLNCLLRHKNYEYLSILLDVLAICDCYISFSPIQTYLRYILCVYLNSLYLKNYILPLFLLRYVAWIKIIVTY